jgi:hypothetical protein
MTSALPCMDMAPGPRTRPLRHKVVASTFPLGVSLPRIPCSRDSHALSSLQPAVWAELPTVRQTCGFPEHCPCMCLCGPCASPACSPCLALLVLGCQELFLCLALLAPARPALPCPFSLCHVHCCVLMFTRVLVSDISFLFVLPFCGSTKRVGPFVLPQKGRTVSSLFLLFLSQILGN